jgi:hypothetical protein
MYCGTATARQVQPSPVAEVAAQAEATARSWLVEEQHAAFDELLAEARSCYKLRDERVNYADASADGITRLAFLEIAQRLQKRGLLLPGYAAHLGHTVPHGTLSSALAGGTQHIMLAYCNLLCSSAPGYTQWGPTDRS